MKTATMILAAGLLSVTATAHAQVSSIGPGPTSPTPANQAALMNSMTAMMPKMDADQLNLMLAEISAKMKAEASATNQQLDVARINPNSSNPDVIQAKLDALQRMQTQTNAAKDLLAIKATASTTPSAPAAPAIPSGMTQAQYQLLLAAQRGEAQDLQKMLSLPPGPHVAMGMQSMQQTRMQQDQIVRPTPQQVQARQQLDLLIRQGVARQMKPQAELLLKNSQWQLPATPGVALTAQQLAQLEAMVTPQHQALLTALTQAQAEQAAARTKQMDAEKQLTLLLSQMGPGTMAALAPKLVEAQRAVATAGQAAGAAQQKVAQAQQQAAPALQAVSVQAATAAQMRAQRAQMTPAQLAEEKAQLERDAALLRKQQLQVAQQQLPIVQQQLKEAQEQLPVRQKAAEAQMAQLKTQQAEQLAAAQARIDNLQKMPPSTPGLQQQMQAAGQAMGGLQRQQQQQLQGMGQMQYQDQQSQQKNIMSLQQMAGQMQQQISMLQAQQAQVPTLPPDMQKNLDAMLAGSTAQIDQLLQALLAQSNQMNSIMSQTQMRP